MKKHKVLIRVTVIIVMIIGITPGLITLFEKTDYQYWKSLVTGIPSIIIGLLIGYLLSKYLLRVWLNREKSIGFKSITIIIITFIAGLIVLIAAWEVTWTIPSVFGWKYIGEFNPWENILDHYLLMIIWGCIPVGVLSVINGLFSFIYLKSSKG